MSGYGKRRLSLGTREDPSTKRQRLEGSDATGEAFTDVQDDSASYPTYMAQPQPTYYPSATPSQRVFHPQATPAEDVFQPQHSLQPQHESQPQPAPCPQPIHPPQAISGASFYSQRPEDQADDIDSGSEDDDEVEQAGPRIPSQTKGKRRASSPAPEEPNAKKEPSARSQRRAGMKNPGRDDRERDEVEKVGGELFWRDPKTGELRKAVYHNDIRAELIAAASALGGYTHQRKRGTRAHDETAFHPEQWDWTPERQHWPRIRDNVLNIHRKANYKGKYYRKPVERIWEHTDGRVILDKDNHPVRKIPDLPATLSSEVEGWYLEVLTRLDNRIQRRDFWARLPHGRDKTGSKPASENMYGLSALGNRRGRWRTSEGLISWKSRGVSEELNDFLRSTISQESLDRNSNEGGRTLTPEEVKHAEDLKGDKKAQPSKAKGRTPASKKARSKQDVRASSEPESSPARNLRPGYPDPTSPFLSRQARPLSTLLAGMERAQEEQRAREEQRIPEQETFVNPLDNAGIDATSMFNHGLGAFPNNQYSFQPWTNSETAGAGPPGDMFDNTIPGSGTITDEDLQGYRYQRWDGVQEQLWNSLNNEIWKFTGLSPGGSANAIGQDNPGRFLTSQKGQNHGDAAGSAMQTQHQTQQQHHGVFDQIDSHIGLNGSEPQSDPFPPIIQDQNRNVDSAGNLQCPVNHPNQSVPPTQPLVAGTGRHQTANSGATVRHNSYHPLQNADKHIRTPCAKAAIQFAGRQMDEQTFSGLRQQTIQSSTKANDMGSPPHIDLTEDHQDSELERHPDIASASYDYQLLTQISEQVMSQLNNNTPSSSQPMSHPPTNSSHPVTASTSQPGANNIANHPSSSSNTTPPSSFPGPITPIEASHITPTTRVHHAILWRLFQPTREAFRAAFRDDAWRPYIARDFVPTITEAMTYMEMLDHYSGEFWRVWTARYGFEVEVPQLARPTVIDDKTARALGEMEEGVNGA